MHEFLFFQLAGPMASWGEIAVGEIRPTQFHPTKSAILGLLAAAMGVDRSDEETLTAIENAYRCCTLTQSSGSLLRDYHTVQVPSFNKKTSYSTRREELVGKKHKLNTLLSSREYITDGFYYIAIAVVEQNSAPFTLVQLKEGLNFPKFTLYLGRKACPVSLPLSPRIVANELIEQSFPKVIHDYRQKIAEIKCFRQQNDQFTICWEEGIPCNLSRVKTVRTRDKYISRKRWQFQERDQFSATWSLKEEV